MSIRTAGDGWVLVAFQIAGVVCFGWGLSAFSIWCSGMAHVAGIPEHANA
ncbi:MAG: hypothetical protein ABJF05_07010 [Paracoccaceae bacterium]